MISAFDDDTTVFMYCRLDIKAMKKAVARYEQIAEIEINFDNSEDLRFDALWGDVSAGATDLSAYSRCGSGPSSHWSEIDRKYRLM